MAKKSGTKSSAPAAARVHIGTASYDNSTGVLQGDAGGGASEAGWHSIESMLRCAKEYQFQHVRKLRKPTHETPDHFALGQMFHAGRARWFALNFATDAKAFASMHKAMRQAAEENKLPVSLKAEQAAHFHVAEYVAYYSRLPKPQPIATEYKLGPTPLTPGDGFQMHRTARLDDVSKYPEAGGALCIGESKTTGSAISDVHNQYELAGQTMLQALLWRNDANGAARFGTARGILLDVTKKAYGKGEKPSFGRFFVPITDYQLDWFARNLRGYLRAAAGIDWNAEAPRNVQSCTRLIGRGRVACEYRDLCRFGRDATGQYVMENGQSLLKFKPDDERKVAPWL
jgi:hypothetical protein